MGFKKLKDDKGQTTTEYIFILVVIMFFGLAVFKRGMFYLRHFIDFEDTLLADVDKVKRDSFYKFGLFKVSDE